MRFEKKVLMVSVMWLLLIPAPMAFAQTQTKPAVELEAAINKQQVDGDLKTAIAAYQKIAANTAAPRDVRSKALLHLAGCYETLGQQAQSVYQQIVTDFGDLPETKQANARLAALRQGDRATTTATMTQRKIELPDSNVFTPYSTDGERVVSKDDATGALMISDLAGRSKRVIFKPKDSVIGNLVAVSRDFSLVAMRLTKPDKSSVYAVVKTDGTGFREIAGDPGGGCGWEISWDNRSVLLCQRQPDGSGQLVQVSLGDGEIHKIRVRDGNNYTFSPDGRFIAYMGYAPESKTYVIPSQGGEPQLVGDDASTVKDWTRDGRYLIIEKPESGTSALYLLPIKDGQRAGKPVFVRYGDFGLGRTTANGAFIYSATPQGGRYTPWLGKLGPTSSPLGWEKLNLGGVSGGGHGPTWSPDGTQIAYVAQNAAAEWDGILRLRTIASGEERELYKGDIGFGCFWSQKSPRIFCVQRDGDGSSHVLSIAVDSGRTESLGTVPKVLFGTPVLLSRNDKAIYLATGLGLVRWEIGAQTWTTIYEGNAWVSRDERWIARSEKGEIYVRAMSGGDWQPRAPYTPGMHAADFTSDGNWLVYGGKDAAGKESLFRVAITGSQPERLGDFPSLDAGAIWISPDGKTLLADSENPFELWSLENFEPKQQAK